MKLLISALLTAALIVCLTSCNKDKDDGGDDRPRLMFVHASPDAPAVDIRINDVLAIAGLAFPQNSPYVQLNVGTNNIKVAPAGSTFNALDKDVPFAAGKTYTIFAIDSVSKIKAVMIEDNLGAPASGKAHVRFFHFSPNAPAIDIAVAGGPVLFSNRSFNDQSTDSSLAAFAPVDAGTYNLEARLAGTNNVVLTLNNVAVTAGKIYTVFAKGTVGGTGVQALGAQVIVNNK